MSNEEWKDGLPGVDYDRLMEAAKQWDTEDYGYIGIGISGNIWFTNNFDCDGSRYFDKRQFEKIFGSIKKREPKNGEVWTCGGEPFVYSDLMSGGCCFLRLDGKNAKGLGGWDFEYAAPSVFAYVARELLGQGESSNTETLVSRRTRVANNALNAARLDEE